MSVATSVVLVPSKRELALMNLRDSDYSEALKHYEGLLRAKGRKVDVYPELAGLYLKFGKVDSSIEMIRRYIAAHPNDIAAWERLAEIYEYAHKPEDRLACLRHLARLAPTRARMHALADVLGALGRPRQKIAVLIQAAKQFRPQAKDLVEIAELQMAQGMYDGAAGTFARISGIDPGAMPEGAFEHWVTALLQTDKEKLAYATAKQALAMRHDRTLAIRLAHLFVSFSRPETGLRLLRDYSGDPTHDSQIAEAIVDIRLTMKQYDKTLEMLSRIKAAGRLTPALGLSYVSAALNANRPRLALQISATLDPADLSQADLQALIDSAEQLRNRAVLIRLRHLTSPERLRLEPLLDASFAVALGNTVQARQAVLRVENEGVDNLSRSDQMALLGIYQRLGENDKALRLLKKLIHDPAAAPRLLTEFADLFLRTGRAREGAALLAKLRDRIDSPQIQNAWARLSVAAGEPQPVSRWLAKASDTELSAPFLRGIFYMSSDRGQTGLAVMAARRIYALQPNESNRRTVASALLADGRKGEALAILQDLARAAPPRSEAVSQLLYLWGPLPGRGALDWLATRARTSDRRPERVQWLKYLVDLGGSQRALDIMNTGDASEPGVAEVKIEALRRLQKDDEAAAIIGQIVPKDRNIGRLLKYEQVAEALGKAALVRTIMRRVILLGPENSDALTRWGAFEYDQKNYAQSAGLLQRAISMTKDRTSIDWKTWYYAGESLLQIGASQKAGKYLARALEILEAKKGRTRAENAALADIFGWTGQGRRALALYRKLLDASPTDAGIRADMANLLMDLGDTRSAAIVLSGRQ